MPGDGDASRDHPHILAIDLGTSGVKLALVSVRGELEDTEMEPTEIAFHPDGGVERPERLPAQGLLAGINAARRVRAR